jgi:hypothetical protein
MHVHMAAEAVVVEDLRPVEPEILVTCHAGKLLMPAGQREAGDLSMDELHVSLRRRPGVHDVTRDAVHPLRESTVRVSAGILSLSSGVPGVDLQDEHDQQEI